MCKSDVFIIQQIFTVRLQKLSNSDRFRVKVKHVACLPVKIFAETIICLIVYNFLCLFTVSIN